MDSTNLLILTAYLIIVALVFNQAYKTLEDKFVVKFDEDALQKELEQKELKEVLEVKFKLSDSYAAGDLKNLSPSIKNIAKECTIFVDWDQCSLRGVDEGTRRVIRVVSDDMEEVPQSQAKTIIRPGETFEAKVSDEKLNDPLFKADKLKKAVGQPEAFTLELFLKMSDTASGKDRVCRLPCHFSVKPLDWTKALTLALQPK
jgi:hypothetical protein